MKGFERWNNSRNKHTFIIGVYHSPIFLPFKSFQRVLKGVVVQQHKIMECFKRFRNIDSHFASKQILKDFDRSNHRRVRHINHSCKPSQLPGEYAAQLQPFRQIKHNNQLCPHMWREAIMVKYLAQGHKHYSTMALHIGTSRADFQLTG